MIIFLSGVITLENMFWYWVFRSSTGSTMNMTKLEAMVIPFGAFEYAIKGARPREFC
jgi:hypothetical protein